MGMGRAGADVTKCKEEVMHSLSTIPGSIMEVPDGALGQFRPFINWDII